MTGIEMMIKSMGIDPERIKQTLVDAQQSVINELTKLHVELISINTRLLRIEAKLETIPDSEVMTMLESSRYDAYEKVKEYVRDNSN